MSATIYSGKILSKDDLKIFVQDQNNLYFNPFSITYSIYRVLFDNYTNVVVGDEPVLEAVDCVPIPFGIGKFFAAWDKAKDLSIGQYKIKWNIAKFSDSPVTQYVENFEVINRVDIMNLSALIGNDGKSLPHQLYGNPNTFAG